MTEADLEYLRHPSAQARLKNLRDSHHNVARLLATGLRIYEVADRTGYSLQRIWMLSKDPSVIELVENYRSSIDESWRESVDEYHRLAVTNMTKAERMLGDRLDDADANGEVVPIRELVAVTSDRMDRFGYSKRAMNVNVNLEFAAKLEAAIARTKKVAAE